MVALAPGPDFALITRNALAHGRRGALFTAAGFFFGGVFWIVASSAGILALLRAAPPLYTALRIVGAFYLGYLGVRALWASRIPPSDQIGTGPAPARGVEIWRQGAISASTNPKLGVFFVTFFPQFINPSGSVVGQIALLGTIFLCIGIGWMAIYGVVVARLRESVLSPHVRQWLERLSGVALLCFGVAVAVQV